MPATTPGARTRSVSAFGIGSKDEILLIGVRGNVVCPAQGEQREWLIFAPRGEHSAKPECFLEMIEQYFPTVPKIELNRRGPARPGWAAWGNQTTAVDRISVAEKIEHGDAQQRPAAADNRRKRIGGLIVKFIDTAEADEDIKKILKKVFLPAIGHRKVVELDKNCGWDHNSPSAPNQ